MPECYLSCLPAPATVPLQNGVILDARVMHQVVPLPQALSEPVTALLQSLPFSSFSGIYESVLH